MKKRKKTEVKKRLVPLKKYWDYNQAAEINFSQDFLKKCREGRNLG